VRIVNAASEPWPYQLKNTERYVQLGVARWGVGSKALLELGEIGFLRFPDAGIGSKTNTNEEQESALATTV
jgi:hypothetical protein